MIKKKIILDDIKDEDLLLIRIRDLPISIKGSWLEECINELYNELDDKGVEFKPECYLADEWLAPDREPVVGIPFFLAHPVLIRLERQMMLDVEGGTKAWCMKLLRHETGHAINYAYKLYNKKKWQELFGHFNKEYKDTYRFRPYSKSFVRHLEDYYAQYHPDEDFAETFAVWLTPQTDWINDYKSWKALGKLKFVDELMRNLKNKPALVKKGKKYWQASKLTSMLGNYYKKKRHAYAEDFHDFHDVNLKIIFSEKNQDEKPRPLAYKLIKKHRKTLINSVWKWTGEKKYIIDGLLKILIVRSKYLKLVIADDQAMTLIKITTYISSLMMKYMYTGRLRGKK
ncbi:MAG: putative zinc-binding metallopeptidase [Bacteroidota bacterium]|nr:putative zinc-binding metallopeptidase [Bacteroidota bacterium]